jgi:hypothetical protein
MKSSILNSFKLILVLISSSTIVFAQCPLPEKIVRSYGKDKYVVSTQSKTGALKAGEYYELAFIAQEGYDYKISSGTESKDGSTASYEIYEMVTQKVGEAEFKKVKKVITASDGTEAIEFQTDKARKLVIKVTLQSTTNPKPECVAILIEDRKSTKLGF